jgi:hypothetical protein
MTTQRFGWLREVVLVVGILVVLLSPLWDPARGVGQSAVPTPAQAADAVAAPSGGHADVASRTVSVSGEAEVRVVPDEVVLNLGVETRDRDLHAAKRQNDAAVQRVLAVAEAFGVDPRHVQTDFVYIDRWYDENVYVVRKSVVITLKDLSRFEDVLTGVLDAGANEVHGIEFRTTELRRYRDEARALAIRAAQEKAVALAGELDQSVGAPQSIREDDVSWWSGYARWWGYRHSGGAMQNVVQEIGGASAALGSDASVAPGQISVRARVTVSFEIF